MNEYFNKIALVTVGLFLQTQIILAVFSCNGKVSGYYADIDTGCQVYHMCDGLGRKFSYTCPNATLFQQRMLICDHWYMVNCSRSQEDYDANYLIGQRARPFVEESGDHSYSRTPRPDLTTRPSEKESNIIYRTGRAHSKTSLNLVGADTEKDYRSAFSTDEPAYAVPSHWSTEYISNEVTTFRAHPRMNPNDLRDKLNRKTFRQSSMPPTSTELFTTVPDSQTQQSVTIEKSTEPSTEAEIKIKSMSSNFASNFQTTPVYSKLFGMPKLGSDYDIGLLPPLLEKLISNTNKSNTNKSNTSTVEMESPQSINFKSIFKATTPVYPKPFELPELPDDYAIGILPPKQNETNPDNDSLTKDPSIYVNFHSNFKATTPMYPKDSNLPEVPDDFDVGLLPPSPEKGNKAKQNTENNGQNLIVNFPSNFKATMPVYPKEFELPKGDLSNIPEELQPPSEITSLEKSAKVNFISVFNATTPTYPKFVEPTSSLSEDIGLLPPILLNEMLSPESPVQMPNSEFEPPRPNISYNRDISLEVNPPTPSKFYEPPKFRPDQQNSGINVTNPAFLSVDRASILKAMNPDQWRYLRKKLLIPEYEFPLDPVSRPNYESDLNSFQAKPAALVNE